MLVQRRACSCQCRGDPFLAKRDCRRDGDCKRDAPPREDDASLHIRRELTAVRQARKRVADAVEIPLEQHGIGEVGVVVPVGVRRERPDSCVLEPSPEVTNQALPRSVEERADGQGHESMMAPRETRRRPRDGPSDPGQATPGSAA